MRKSRWQRAALGLACAAILAAGTSARAEHFVLQADHAPQAAVMADEPLNIRVGAGTSCFIGYLCSWVQATVLYELPDGAPARAWVEGPYQPAQVLVVTIPVEHIAGPTFAYRIEVSQVGCYDDCHEHTVSLPRAAFDHYTVEVLDG